mgnify:CR=1 FL=1
MRANLFGFPCWHITGTGRGVSTKLVLRDVSARTSFENVKPLYKIQALWAGGGWRVGFGGRLRFGFRDRVRLWRVGASPSASPGKLLEFTSREGWPLSALPSVLLGKGLDFATPEGWHLSALPSASPGKRLEFRSLPGGTARPGNV